MQRRLMLSLALVGCLAGLTSSATAAPLVLNSFEAVSLPRKDLGTGLCGSVVKFVNQSSPLLTIDDATGLLDRQSGDPNIVSRVSREFGNMNFSVGPSSEADFHAPSFSDDFFPFCLAPMSMPTGADDNNIAMRLRGYINITDTLGGQPATFAINCDDGCALRLGKSRQLVTQANEISPVLTGRRARWVTFVDPGLYPVEIIYFQNATTGYFEWSHAAAAVFSADDVAVDNVQWGQEAAKFMPLSSAELYSGIFGSNPPCQECGGFGMDCAMGNFCADGLCQACNVSEHCGPKCITCPASTPLCSAGKCVQCISDAMCAPGATCNTTNGTCQAMPTGCLDSTQCPPNQICGATKVCEDLPVPCTAVPDCQTGKICDCVDGSASCAQKVCIQPWKGCAQDADCQANFHCDSTDTTAPVCKPTTRYYYEGGLGGCQMSGSSPGGGNALWLLGLLGLLLFGFRGAWRRSY